MKPWVENPSAQLETVFADIAATRMAGLPICNAALSVEAIGFQRRADGHWAGILITPWGINLLCLPGEAASWPNLPACAKHYWQFPSGEYEFTVADEARIGNYHLCSLFSPAVEFPSQEQARLTALAVAHALGAEPLAESLAEAQSRPASRRAFLGLAR